MKLLVTVLLGGLLWAGFCMASPAADKAEDSRYTENTESTIANLDPNPEPDAEGNIERPRDLETLDDFCGTPTETESNNTCATADTYVLHCAELVYGYRTYGSDVDFFKFIVPAMTALTIWMEDGSSCSTYPTSNITADIYSATCTDLSENSRNGFTISNFSTTDSIVRYLRVQRRQSTSPSTRYRVVTTCEPITNYCEHPIKTGPGAEIGNSYIYEKTVNTCLGINVVDSVYESTCGQDGYVSGQDVVFKVVLRTVGLLDSVMASGAGDNQLMIFADCASPRTTCLASSDKGANPYAGKPEIIENLSLTAGTYFISVSQYPLSGAIACGDITLRIISDIPLAVMLLSFGATAGDGEVLLNWRTASENDLNRFEILRDGFATGSVPATNQTTGDNYSWTDRGLINGITYSYTLMAVDESGNRQELAVSTATPRAAAAVSEYALYQNYPNPFNPATTISFDIVEQGFVTLAIYNVLGQNVRTAVQEIMTPGNHVVAFDASDLSSGVYLYRLTVNGFSAEKKMLLMK